MWLSGKEAVACGLANEIRGGQADTTVITAVFKQNSDTEAYKYAACVTNNIHKKLEAHMAEEKTPTVEETETKADAEVTMEAKAEDTEAVEPEEEEAKAECGEDETKAECGEDEPKAEDEPEEEPEEEPEVEDGEGE